MKKIIALPAMTITLAASYILHSVSYDPIVDSDDVTEISIQNESQISALTAQNSAQAKQKIINITSSHSVSSDLESNKTTVVAKNLPQAEEFAKIATETIEIIPFIVPESASQITLAGIGNEGETVYYDQTSGEMIITDSVTGELILQVPMDQELLTYNLSGDFRTEEEISVQTDTIVSEIEQLEALPDSKDADDNNSFITINNDGIEEHIIVEELILPDETSN